MRKNLIGDDGSIVVDEDVFDGEGRDFGKEDPAQGVGDGGINAGERKDGVRSRDVVELDVAVLKHISPLV